MRVAILLLVLLPAGASALPRFAARAGMECIQCHVNPSGGGVRNEYGAAVFEQTILPASGRRDRDRWVRGEGEPPPEDVDAPFTGQITEWLRIGADFRTAYIRLQPERGIDGAEPEITSTFFLMQADLYHAARLNRFVTLVLDVGVYSGFEAWGLLRPFRTEGEDVDFLLKVGRYVPAFGIRDVEHQLTTREAVGFGTSDRDTGVEGTLFLGAFTLQAGIFNGTLGDTAFDTAGRDRGGFEKAVSTRASWRFVAGPLRAQLGGSLYYGHNGAQVNPLFASALPPDRAPLAGEGVNDLRTGPFVTANLGRVTYLGDLVLVRDSFTADLPDLRGYASYQELSVLAMQGLDLVATLEFLEPDADIAGDGVTRVAAIVEWFPWPYVELRPMVRRSFGGTGPTGGSLDLVLFLHLFL